MKIFNIYTFAAFMSLMCACGGNDHEGHDHDGHNHEAGHVHGEGESHDAHDHEEGDDHDHGNEIILKPEMAKRMGVETQRLSPTSFYEVIRVNGRITPSPTDVAVAVAPTSGIVNLSAVVADGKSVSNGTRIATVSAKNISGGDVDEAGRIAIASAKRELDRMKPLLEEGLITTKEYNEALSRYESALAAYSPKAASGSVNAPISGVITNVLVNQGQYVEAGTPLVEISKTSRLTLRADLPEKYYGSLRNIRSANFRTHKSDEVVRLVDVGGSRTTDASNATAQNGYFPVYFTFNNNGKAVPGSYVEVFLIGDTRADAIVVPIEAITEQQGSKYVYVKVDDEGYERRLVKTGGNDGDRVEILSGVQSGDDVVVKGATVIRLAENSGSIPEGHSHNH